MSASSLERPLPVQRSSRGRRSSSRGSSQSSRALKPASRRFRRSSQQPLHLFLLDFLLRLQDHLQLRPPSISAFSSEVKYLRRRPCWTPPSEPRLGHRGETMAPRALSLRDSRPRLRSFWTAPPAQTRRRQGRFWTVS